MRVILAKSAGFCYGVRRAVELAARSGVLLLTGGPGTGKTTSTRGTVTLLERMGLTVLLLAPRGLLELVPERP